MELNPEYSYVFYNNDDCIQFIKDNFDESVMIAYNHLRPNAYKADLFRYCYMYIHGGCYFDNKYIPRKSLKKIMLYLQKINLEKKLMIHYGIIYCH